MKLEVLRYSSQNDSTLGMLFDITEGRTFLCYTLEDKFRTQKVKGETRIPHGEYEVTLRTKGGFHNKYKNRFPNMHKGMLWVRNVPNFEFILIHLGNREKDTAGCLLVGETSQENVTEKGSISKSKLAYKRVYPPIANALQRGEKVSIKYINHDMV